MAVLIKNVIADNRFNAMARNEEIADISCVGVTLGLH